MKTKLLIAVFLLPLVASAQTYFEGLHKEFEAGVFVSTSGENPFWLRSNQFGSVPTDAPGVTLRARISPEKARPLSGFQGYAFPDDDETPRRRRAFSSLQSVKKDFSFNYAVEAVVNAGKTNQVLLPEIFASIRWKGLAVYAGRRREIYGLTDSTLSSGSYIWSGNALPLPKVQISTAGYVPLGRFGLVAINAGINHGWFSDNGIVKNHYLHQKWVYLRIGRPKSKVKIYGGVNHNVQWGGYSDILKDITYGQYSPTIDGYLAPFPLYSYQFVLIPFLQKFKDLDPAKVPSFDGGLAVGNQLGSVDLGGSFENEEVLVAFYHQIPYDYARSIANFYNIEDGTNTLSFTFKESQSLRKVVVEYLNTSSQGRYRFGKVTNGGFGEYDDYFSHGQYTAWSNKDRIIGTPFVDIATIDGKEFTNNRVHALSLSATGIISDVSYLARYSYTHGLGTYGILKNTKQHYLLATVSKRLGNNQSVNFSLAADFSNVSGNNTGIFTSYRLSL